LEICNSDQPTFVALGTLQYPTTVEAISSMWGILVQGCKYIFSDVKKSGMEIMAADRKIEANIQNTL
jgi:hypothetical protein